MLAEFRGKAIGERGAEVTLEFCALDSPVGPLHLFARAGAVCLITFGEAEHIVRRRFGRTGVTGSSDPAGAATALRRYFAGELACLSDLRVDTGGTPFQARVWHALRGIPAGETISYRDLAQRVGSPAAVRAVGAANGANPIPIIIPCHRVIGANGRLVGYGGGMARKDWLLRHEGWRALAH